jgi:diguanylate cyclase (GGDEF)-like protein
MRRKAGSSRKSQGVVYALLTAVICFAAAGIAIQRVNAGIGASIGRAARFETTFNVSNGKIGVARLRVALALWRVDPSSGRRQDLSTKFEIVAGWAADLQRGAFGKLVLSNSRMAASVAAINTTVGQLRPLLAALDAPGAAERAEALLTSLDEPVAALLSGSLARSVDRSRADAEILRQQQAEQLSLELGLLASAFGLIGVLLWQKREVQRLHLRQVADTQRFEFLAAHDSLTGLRNRAAFSERIEQAFVRRARDGGEVALLTLDVDRFKTINDALGHAAGDRLLISIASRLKHLSAQTGAVTAARLGGDEFALLVEGPKAAERARRLGQATLEALQRPHQIGALSITSNASIGLAHAPSHGETPSDIIRGSDIALNRAKSDGRGVISVFDTAKDRDVIGRRALESNLRRALELDEFEPYYQPQVELATGRIVAAEALIRWNRRGKLILPRQIIPLAEESGLIVAIDRRMLELVCADALRLPRRLQLSINLSAAHFLCDDFVSSFADILTRLGVDPRRIAFEITESIMLTNETRTRDALLRLRNLGAAIALDDFGAGFSSLGYLRRFPFDMLKVDRAFIDDVDASADSFEILRAIVTLGGSLGMSVIVEGIERRTQAEWARAAGCGLGQGYLFASPMPFADLAKLLEGDDRDALSAA